MQQGIKNGPPPLKTRTRTNSKIIEFSDFSSQGKSSIKENSLMSDHYPNLNSFDHRNNDHHSKTKSTIGHRTNRLRERFIKGFTILDILLKRKCELWRLKFFSHLFKHTEEQTELVNNLLDINKYESMKFFLRKLVNILELNIQKKYLCFLRKFIIHEKYTTIKKKKSFIYFHKLLVWRNKILDHDYYYSMIGLIKKFYFYHWARLLQYETLKIGKVRHRIKSIFEKVEKTTSNRRQYLCRAVFDNLLNYNKGSSNNAKVVKNVNNFVSILQSFLDRSYSNQKRTIFSRYIISKYKCNNEGNFDADLVWSYVMRYSKGKSNTQIRMQLLASVLIYSLKLKKISYCKGLLYSFRRWRYTQRPETNVIQNRKKLNSIATLFNLNRILLNKVRSSFINFIELTQIKTLMKLTPRNIHKYLMYFENKYNNYLLNSCWAYFLLDHLVLRRNIFLFNISYIRRMCSPLHNYFCIWKYKCIRVSKEKKRSYTYYSGLIILSDIALRMKRANKRYALLRMKRYKELLSIRMTSALQFISLIKLFITRKYLIHAKYQFINEIKFNQMTEYSLIDKKKRNRSIIFCRQMEYTVKKNSLKYNLRGFFSKLKEKSPLLHNKALVFKLCDIIHYLQIKIVKSQCTTFFVKLRKLKAQTKTSIDKLIVDNVSRVSLCMHESIIKKTSLLKSVKFLSKLHNIYVSKFNFIQNKKLYKYFHIWKRQIIYDNIAVIQEINTFEELHEDLKLKILEYTEANDNLELRLQEITLRGEQCQLCSKYVEEPSESNMIETQMTINSIKDEEMNLNKIIPRTSITMNNNPLMNEDQPSPFARISKEELNNLRRSVKESKEEIHSMLQRSSSINTSNLFDKDDNFIIDEKKGGLEYLDYLQKNSIEWQNKLKSLDDEYSPKCSQLLEEIEQLCIEIGYNLE